MKILSAAADFHDFEKEPVALGKFVEVVLREEDSPDGESKKGDVLGYMLENVDSQNLIVSNSYMIKKSIEKTGIGAILGIRFKGQTLNSKKQKVNKFEVIEFDSFDEATAHYDKPDKLF